MAGTQYTISGEGFESQTRSKKEKAVELADALRAEHKTTVTVTTGSGTEVYVTKARKQQKRTKPFTRVDARDYADKLGEGVKLPRNFEVAYLRPRSSLALLRKVTQDAVHYLVFDLATGASEVATSTRDGGRIMREVKKGDLQLVA